MVGEAARCALGQRRPARRASAQDEVASRPDRAQFPHRSVIAFRPATQAPAVRFQLLDERRELLAPPPATIAADAAHPTAPAAGPVVPPEGAEEPLHPALTPGTAVVPPYA